MFLKQFQQVKYLQRKNICFRFMSRKCHFICHVSDIVKQKKFHAIGFQKIKTD